MKTRSFPILLLATLMGSCHCSDEVCFVSGCDAPETTGLTFLHRLSYPMGPPADVTIRVCAKHESDARDSESDIGRGMRNSGMALKVRALDR